MSYIRACGPYKYVDNDMCVDYVFPTGGYDNVPEYIEDYGSITNNGLIELLFRHWKTEDTLFKEHIIKRLAEKLNVKLRGEPMSDDDYMETFYKQAKEGDENE